MEEGKTSEIFHVGQNLTFIIGIDLVNDYSVITKKSGHIEDGVFLLPGTWGIYPWFEEDGEELIELLHYWRQQIFLYYEAFN